MIVMLFGNTLSFETESTLLHAPEDLSGGGADPKAPSDEELIADIRAMTDQATAPSDPSPAKRQAQPVQAPAPEAQPTAADQGLDTDILQTIAATVASAEKRAEATGGEAPAPAAEAPQDPTLGDTKNLTSVSYASVAEALEKAQKESTGRYSRGTIDDDALLAELHALIGDGPKPMAQPVAHEEVAEPQAAPAPRPAARLTQEVLTDVPEEFEDVAQEEASGVPGWVKGAFILLVSMLLGAMTFYAVASDLMGKVF